MVELNKKDGLWGWVIVVAATVSQLILGGICFSGGVFYVLFRENLGSDAVTTSWLCALPPAVWYFATPIGSFVTNHYGYRMGAFLGGISSATGLALSFFASDIRFLFFSYGLLIGLGFGMNYTSCLAALNDYFDKYKTIATGIVTVGHNSAMVIYPSLIGILDDTYGWQGTLLILGAVTFNMCACAAFMQPRHEVSIHDTAHKRKPYFQISVLKKSTFLSLCFSNLLCNLGIGIYFLLLPSYILELGYTKNDVALILSIFGISNSVGKVFFSFVGQHPATNATVLYTGPLILTGIVVLLSPLFRTSPTIFILPGLVGFCFSVTGALIAIVVFSIVGDKRFADGIGLSMPFKALGNLIGGPVGGAMYSVTGSCSTSIHLSGAALIGCGLAMIQPIIYQCRKKNVLSAHDKIAEEKVFVSENNDKLLSDCKT